MIVNLSTGLKGIIKNNLHDVKTLKFEYWRQNRIAERN